MRLPISTNATDRPSSPANLSLSAMGEGRLHLEWIPSFTPKGVATWYRVIVMDVTERKVVLNCTAPSNGSYEYHHDLYSGPPCRVYNFSVMASNAAGDGDLSESITSTVPTGIRLPILFAMLLHSIYVY